jgi:hypothetical protein
MADKKQNACGYGCPPFTKSQEAQEVKATITNAMTGERVLSLPPVLLPFA